MVGCVEQTMLDLGPYGFLAPEEGKVGMTGRSREGFDDMHTGKLTNLLRQSSRKTPLERL
jgi:hypothetical protein